MTPQKPLLSRIWLAIPYPVFAVAGVAFFLAYFLARLPDYRHFWTAGPAYRFADGRVIYLPWTRILSDWTGILVVLGFLVRTRPIARNPRGAEAAIELLGSYWLMLPFVAMGVCGLLDRLLGSQLAPEFQRHWVAGSLSLTRMLLGAGLVAIGNIMDTWGYSVLLRSFSLGAEARPQPVSGPYRVMRHPVYFGQILAQAGIYLFWAQPNVGWVFFWLIFCAIQLRRAWREEQVMEATFGTAYRAWKRRTFWFWSDGSDEVY